MIEYVMIRVDEFDLPAKKFVLDPIGLLIQYLHRDLTVVSQID